MIALVDADEIAYKVALAYQRKWYVITKDGKPKWKYHLKEEAAESIGNRLDLDMEVEIEILELTGVKERINTVISRILFNTNSSDIKFYLSGANNFRFNLATLQPYKGNRDPSTKPHYLESIKEEFRSRGAEYVDFLEGDDLLSAYNSIITDKTVICSTDKDLRTVPSLNYNIDTKKLKFISEDEGRYNFWYQVLIGDSTDNIPSPHLLGPATAEKILKESKGKGDMHYYQNILKEYPKFLKAKNKSGDYRTKWYNGCEKSIEEVIWEVGNLLWMHRTLDPEERWSIPSV